MSAPKFITKDGFLTRYALACGYIETSVDWNHTRRVAMDALNISLDLFGVTTYDETGHIVMETVQGLKPARKLFLQKLKEAGTTRRINAA